jgi:hypothetical protein
MFDAAAFKPYAQFLEHLLTRSTAPDLTALLGYRTLASTILPRDASLQSPPTESLMLVFARGNLDERDSRERVVAAVQSALNDVRGATLTGMSVLSHNTERTIRRDLPRLIGVAGALAGIYLLIHFRNVRATLLALAPGIFGMIALLAFVRVTDQKLNLINLAALPLLIGIDVDYGIFLVHLARSRREGSASADIAPAVQAIILCAASTILGFASLITTSVPAVRSLGILMSVGIGACLFATLFLLLPMLIRNDRSAEADPTAVSRRRGAVSQPVE